MQHKKMCTTPQHLKWPLYTKLLIVTFLIQFLSQSTACSDMSSQLPKGRQLRLSYLWRRTSGARWRTIQFATYAAALLICTSLLGWLHGNLQTVMIAKEPTIVNMLREIEKMKHKIEVHERRFWLDPLEPLLQYRPKYWLGKTDQIEDKDQVTPYFLGNFVNASDPVLFKRRIYIDLGLHDFGSSVCWMMQHYPIRFDFVYGFECQWDLSNLEALRGNVTECVSDGRVQGKGYQVDQVLENFQFLYNYVGLDDNTGSVPPTRGLSQFIRDIGIAEDDFVVLKIDVEGLEFDLLNRIMEDGTYRLIDEIFVEMHYNHPEMHPWHWYIFPHSRADVQALLTKARDMGIFIHAWP